MLVLMVFAVAACGRPRESIVRRPGGYGAHLQHAEGHSRRAEQHREAARAADAVPLTQRYQCGDVALNDLATSGGERLTPTVPCWDVADETAARQRALAAREQRRADDERRAATRLVEDENAACRGLAEHELDHSPFEHRTAIAAVIPHREAGRIRGVRIVFRAVPGLTAAWMRQAIACHRARFERLGGPATYLPDDPSLVIGAIATVEMHGRHLEVVIASSDDGSARVALGRAQDLVRDRTAVR